MNSLKFGSTWILQKIANLNVRRGVVFAVPGRLISQLKLAIYIVLMLVADNLAREKKVKIIFLVILVPYVGQLKMNAPTQCAH